MINELEQLYSMLGVTDQVQAGERIGFLVGQSIMVPKLEARFAALEAELADADGLSKMLGDLLREIDLTIRGPEPELTRSGYPDLPQRVKTLVEERNAAQAKVAELQEQIEWFKNPKALAATIHADVEEAVRLQRLLMERFTECRPPRDGLMGWAHAALSVTVAQAGQVPDVLFDGFAVYQALSDKAKGRTSSHNVSDTLDAVVKLMRAAAPAQGGE